MNVLEVHLLGLGLGMSFSSNYICWYLWLKLVMNQSHIQCIFISSIHVDTNGHYLYEWFCITNMNVLEVHLLGLGLGMYFPSKLYLLIFLIESSDELIWYAMYIHFIHPYGYKWTLPIWVVLHNKHECTRGALIGPRVRYVFFFKIIFVGIFYWN